MTPAKRAIIIPATIGAKEDKTHVTTAEPAVKLTYEDYCAAPAGEGYELLAGELVTIPAASIKHYTIRRCSRRVSHSWWQLPGSQADDGGNGDPSIRPFLVESREV